MFSYFIVITLVFISSSLWKLYYCLELQWIMIVLFFIIAYSIYSGLFNYLITNLFVSILIIIGFIIICLINIIIGCYGKLGYFPFIIILLLIYSSCSFVFIIYDYLSKICYFHIINIIININLLYYGIDYMIILFNFYIILFFYLFINSIKHFFLIISFYTLLFKLFLIIINRVLYLLNYLFYYLLLFFIFLLCF